MKLTALKFRLGVILFFISTFFLLTSKPIFAAWTKHPQNPIFSPTASWEGKIAKSPMLVFEENEYKMWYVGNNGGGWRIGYASSKNGINDWNKPVNNPVIDIKSEVVDGWQEFDTHEPFVLYDQTKGYQMWYTSVGTNWRAGPDRFRLRYATSEDGINWNEKNWVLKGTLGKWDSGGIYRGHSIIKTATGYQMWYSGTGWDWNWKIGYATSIDGLNWEKQNSGNPVITRTRPWESECVCFPNVIFENGIYKMWYATGPKDLPLPTKIVYATSTDGIHWDKPADKNPVLTLGSSSDFDRVHVSSPFVIKEGNIYKMWYSGSDVNDTSRWQIGYAENVLSELTPTPTPSPTPTPTATPTPTPSLLQPIVMLPGLGASWNHKAMILGVDQPQTEWYMTPGIKVYDGLIQTFENAGYEKNKSLFIFNYDWRQPVETIAKDLEWYINHVVDPAEDVTIDLVGHSLGGLVARTYVQSIPANLVDQLITLGSPHQGVTKVYHLWEGGDLDSAFSAWQRIGVGLLLHLNKPEFSTSAQTIQAIAPVLKDLLPTFPFLKKNGTEKPVDQMQEQNNWLITLNSSVTEDLLSLLLNTVSGNIPDSTLRWINVNEPNWLEKVLNLWPDGKSTGEEEYSLGDKTVLSQSAQFGTNIWNLTNIDHRGLIETSKGQEKIMQILGLTPSSISTISADINYEPALIFQLSSPATLSVQGPDGQPAGYGDDKLIVIPGAATGGYQVKIIGTEKGEYHLHIGQVVNTKDIWITISGIIKSGDIIGYSLNFNPDSPLAAPIEDQTGNNHQISARAKLNTLKNEIKSSPISTSIKISSFSQINRIIRYLQQNMFEKTIIYLYSLRSKFSYWHSRGKLSQVQITKIQNKIMEIIADLEFTYVASKTGIYPQSKLSREFYLSEKYFDRLEKQLKRLALQEKAKTNHGLLYSFAKEKLDMAQTSSSYQAHINALGAKYLSLEGIKFIK